MFHHWAIALLLLPLVLAGNPSDDLITSLPGADEALFASLPNMYSGYLDLPSSSKHMFYWLVEAEESPENAPVALWTNGGPGCSGFIGLMTEQGPFRPTKNGSLVANPGSWHLADVNMLFVEQPVGVGFSYSDDPTKDYVTGDAQAAADLYAAIVEFQTQYSGRYGSDFYLTSESYGGHYLPTTARYILDQPGGAAAIGFKGFFLGNPWTDPKSNAVGRVQTLYGHGLVPKPAYDKFAAACLGGETTASGSSNSGGGEGGDAECLASGLEVLSDSSYPSQNIDALSYPSCDAEGALVPRRPDADGFETAALATIGRAQRLWLLARGGAADASELMKLGLLPPLPSRGHMPAAPTTAAAAAAATATEAAAAASAPSVGVGGSPSTSDAVLAYDPCVDNYALAYLNRADVQAAIHVQPANASSSSSPSSPSSSSKQEVREVRWSECSFSLDYNPADGMVPMMPLYQSLIADPTPLKLEVYSGDDDSNCPTLGTMQWAYGLDLPETQAWNPWYYEDPTYGHQFAGFQVSWEGNLTLSTVHGAGHEVPTYKAAAALELFKRYIARE